MQQTQVPLAVHAYQLPPLPMHASFSQHQSPNTVYSKHYRSYRRQPIAVLPRLLPIIASGTTRRGLTVQWPNRLPRTMLIPQGPSLSGSPFRIPRSGDIKLNIRALSNAALNRPIHTSRIVRSQIRKPATQATQGIIHPPSFNETTIVPPL